MQATCATLPSFDLTGFLETAKRLSLFSYIWHPPGSDRLRIDHYYPQALSVEHQEFLMWAETMDPRGIEREAYSLLLWEFRPPGVEVVLIEENFSRHLAMCA